MLPGRTKTKCHWSAWYLKKLTNNWLDQAVRPIAAPVQHLNRVPIGIEKDKEVVMPKQAHLLHGLIFCHRQNDKRFAPADQREQLTGFIHRHFLFHHFGCGAAVAASAVVFSFVTLRLALHFVECSIEGGVDVIGSLFCTQNESLAMNGDLGHLSILGTAYRFDMGQLYADFINLLEVAFKLTGFLFDIFTYVIGQPHIPCYDLDFFSHGASY